MFSSNLDVSGPTSPTIDEDGFHRCVMQRSCLTKGSATVSYLLNEFLTVNRGAESQSCKGSMVASDDIRVTITFSCISNIRLCGQEAPSKGLHGNIVRSSGIIALSVARAKAAGH